MRGSPLLRTLLILVAIIASGVGFFRLTDRAVPVITKAPALIGESADFTKDRTIRARCFVEVSGSVESIFLTGSSEEASLVLDTSLNYAGDVLIDLGNPVLFLKIEWADQAPGHRFAKLTIEAPGKKTFTHVFDSPDEIDNFVELPF